MTDLQEAEFDMLRVVLGICEQLNITYYLVCGTALGAVKYHGFIPWDDDVDIAIKRSDYEVFCEKAPSLLPEGLFLQTADSDPEFPQIYGKVRNTATTFIETSVSELNINHGIYVDVFPLDGYPKARWRQIVLEFKKKILHLQLASAYKMDPSIKPTTKAFILMERMCGFDRRIQKTVKRLNRALSQYSPEVSDLWCNHGNWQGKLEYASKEQYGSGAWAMFEGLKVRIPEKYDEYLSQKYGDWRADLPIGQQVGHHYTEVIDLKRPYTDYIVKLGKGKIRLKTSEELKKDGITPPEGYQY